MFSSHGPLRRSVTALAGVALVVATAVSAESAAATPPDRPRFAVSHPAVVQQAAGHGLPRVLARTAAGRPAGLPDHGSYAFLLRLRTASTLATYERSAVRGVSVAAAAARAQLATIRSRQAQVARALPHGARVLYRMHSVLAGLAVESDVHDYRALERIRGVRAVYPIAPKTPATSYAAPLQGVPAAWSAHGDLGAGTSIAVIDTGVDYTHEDFGGPGTRAAYHAARLTDTAPPSYPDTAKIRRGHDFAGDSYDADPADPGYQPVPHPDANPLDCDGHGTHVAGIAAGLGVTPAGSTYAGDYTSLGTLTPTEYQQQFRIGPGMAPAAEIIPLKVFGCRGSTTLIAKAIDWAVAHHVDVVNMSLGSDFTSAQDGDAVAADAASRLGVSVVAASGNAGDEYDAGGAPGDAPRVIAVADSVDAYSQLDALNVTFSGVAQNAMGALRSVLYQKWGTQDLAGRVVRLTQTGNADGCRPVTQSLTGKVALVAWHDAAPDCPSKTVADHLRAAGAIGFVLADDTDAFSAGINGDTAIPGVLVTRSGALAIRGALGDGMAVRVTSTTASGYPQLLPALDDTLNASSSRGVRGAGDVKPDVSAVGTSVFSAAMGSGSQGVSYSGTSMASPMVAGVAALVRSAHPGWTPEQVKADIMNTAGANLYTGGSHTGRRYAPNRVGAGRIRADRALDNRVLAYVRDDPGAVSVSFGPVQVTGAMTLSKTVRVVNRSGAPAQFTAAYRPLTSVPGVGYSVSPASVSVAAGGSATVTVRLVVSRPGAMTKTGDPTVPRRVERLPREFVSDASGLVQFTPVAPYAGPALRVPVYSAPRPAARMTQASTLTLHGTGMQQARLRLTGHGLDLGSGGTRIRSLVSGFELAARSGRAPVCRFAGAQRCVHFPQERSADLRYVGVTSDAPLVRRPLRNASVYFSITTQRPWRTPVGPQEFDVVIDTNGDGIADAVLYNTRLNGEDVFLSELVDITHPSRPFVRDDELINDRFGDVDTALFDSDTLVLPIWLRTLGPSSTTPALPGFGARHTRIRYGIVSFGESGVVDDIGVDLGARRLRLSAGHLTTDVLRPGVTAYNASISNVNTLGLLLNADRPGTSLIVHRDLAAYRRDGGLGALLVHFHDAVGAKAQVVRLRSA